MLKVKVNLFFVMNGCYLRYSDVNIEDDDDWLIETFT